ncbi:MAG: iron-containing alcohol dehydrogenase [Spirochaetales bacterium]|nr:iron-containing alcohol dehydrogenase [Spirochaetales bacterium]
MNFQFATAGRILFGPGTFAQASGIALGLGRRPLLVAGRRRGHLAGLLVELEAAGAAVATFTAAGEPSTDSIASGLALARSSGCDSVIAVGGGSALDSGKAIAALMGQEGGLFDYLEVIGKARPLTRPKVPLLAAPTTAGTGAECTCNAVILSPEHRVKVSLRHTELFPTVALVDPELTATLPPAETASSGLDALTQLIEPFVSSSAQPLTDALCRDGIVRAGRSLQKAFADGRDAAARTDMSLAAMFSGMALANAKLGAVHGLAGPLGGLTGAPHGLLCAALLPSVMQTNVAVLRERGENRRALDRYDEIARALTGSPGARAEEGAAWIKELCGRLAVPSLSTLGLKRNDVSLLIEKAQKASSMKGNPVLLSAREIEKIIEVAF